MGAFISCHVSFPDDDETRLASPSTPQILKCVVNKLTMVPSMSPLVQQLVHHMLEALTVKTSYQLTEGKYASL